MSKTAANSNKWAAITGASSGLGYHFAQLLADRGYHLVLGARREDRLLALKQDILSRHAEREVLTEKVDLCLPEDRLRFIEVVTKNGLDLLVNNAGFGSVGHFCEYSIQRELEMVELNCKALLELSYAGYQYFYPRKRGVIINVSSALSFTPTPYMSTYAATKAFVTSFSIALDTEAREHGIRVLCHCPGATESEFHQAAGLRSKIDIVEAMETEHVVSSALSAMDAGKALVVSGWKNQALTTLAKLLPTTVASRIVGKSLKPYLGPPENG